MNKRRVASSRDGVFKYDSDIGVGRHVGTRKRRRAITATASIALVVTQCSAFTIVVVVVVAAAAAVAAVATRRDAMDVEGQLAAKAITVRTLVIAVVKIVIAVVIDDRAHKISTSTRSTTLQMEVANVGQR
jgi:uncharacterized membrane protein